MATIEAKLGEDFMVVATNTLTVGDMVREPELVSGAGWLSVQALRQGYFEEAEEVVLALEHGVFVVKTWMKDEVFGSLNLARKEFVRLVKASLREDLQKEQALAA